MKQRMKGSLCLAAILTLLWMSSPVTLQARTSGGPKAPAQGGQPSSAPSMEIAQTHFDFGEVTEGEVVLHDFLVKNTGTDTLHITQVKAG